MIALAQAKARKPFSMATFDVETQNWIDFVMIGFFDGETYTAFDSLEKFLRHVLKPRYAGWRIFGHNSGNFDFNFLMDIIEESFPHLRCVILSDNMSLIRVMDSGNRSWYFVDSIKLLPESLKNLGETFDVAHKKKDMDLNEIGWNAKTIEYNEYDCRCLHECITAFHSWFKDKQVPIKTTTASQSMAFFRNTLKTILPNITAEEEKFVRQSYAGGRTEIFKMACDRKIYCYDVKSMYPYVMKNYAMPVGSPEHTNDFDCHAIGFHSATVYVPEELYLPILPLKHHGKMLFPTGMINGVWSSAELALAEKHGCDIEVFDGLIFGEDYIFDEFIDTLYPLKQNGNAGQKKIAKLTMNSCYGKFAQERIKRVMVREPDIAKTVGLIPYDDERSLYLRETTSRATFILPHIAAWITSQARCKLFDYLHTAGDSHIYYCDTDSVMTTKKLPSGDNLGDLTLEKTGEGAFFLLPKLYSILTESGVINRAKGFDRDFVRQLTFDDYEKASDGDYSSFKQSKMVFAHVKESLKRNDKFVSMIERKKSIQSVYDKRRVLSNFDTAPLIFN